MVTRESSTTAPSRGEVIVISGASALDGISASGHATSTGAVSSSPGGGGASSRSMGCVQAAKAHAAIPKQAPNRLKPIRPYVADRVDRKSTRLNSSHVAISYAVV